MLRRRAWAFSRKARSEGDITENEQGDKGAPTVEEQGIDTISEENGKRHVNKPVLARSAANILVFASAARRAWALRFGDSFWQATTMTIGVVVSFLPVVASSMGRAASSNALTTEATCATFRKEGAGKVPAARAGLPLHCCSIDHHRGGLAAAPPHFQTRCKPGAAPKFISTTSGWSARWSAVIRLTT